MNTHPTTLADALGHFDSQMNRIFVALGIVDFVLLALVELFNTRYIWALIVPWGVSQLLLKSSMNETSHHLKRRRFFVTTFTVPSVCIMGAVALAVGILPHEPIMVLFLLFLSLGIRWPWGRIFSRLTERDNATNPSRKDPWCDRESADSLEDAFAAAIGFTFIYTVLLSQQIDNSMLLVQASFLAIFSSILLIPLVVVGPPKEESDESVYLDWILTANALKKRNHMIVRIGVLSSILVIVFILLPLNLVFFYALLVVIAAGPILIEWVERKWVRKGERNLRTGTSDIYVDE